MSGYGVCTDGTLDGPRVAACSAMNYSAVARQVMAAGHRSFSSPGAGVGGGGGKEEMPGGGGGDHVTYATSWHYDTCPPENECLNGHHSCHATSEVCHDKPQG